MSIGGEIVLPCQIHGGIPGNNLSQSKILIGQLSGKTCELSNLYTLKFAASARQIIDVSVICSFH